MDKFIPITTGIDEIGATLAAWSIVARTTAIPQVICLVIVIFVASLPTAFADQVVILSVKVIRATNGTRPSGGIAAAAGFAAEVTSGNQVLANTGRGYRLVVVEFIDIQPPVPQGQPADFWFSLPARSNRAAFQTAALGDQTTWAWRTDAINVYVNNTGSGQCSFPPEDFAISLGKSMVAGTVLHEIGHFFNLRHTHLGDNDGVIGPWTDGDGLAASLADDPDASLADINAHYPLETQQMRDDLFHNVMSYHVEDRLLPAQMDLWVNAADGSRLPVLSQRTWYVNVSGSDAANGDTPATAFATLSGALTSAATSVRPPSDCILMQAATYTAPGNYIATPCVLRAAGGAATVSRQ